MSELVDTSEIADGIIGATAGWPSSVAIRGLVEEYLLQDSQEKRIVILLDILDCLRQDMDAASKESTELNALMARMSSSRAKFLGVPRRRGCAHVKGAGKNWGASGAEGNAADLVPGRQAL